MEEYQKRFSGFLADSGALYFDEDLILKDGRPTPYFVNMGMFKDAKKSVVLGGAYADMFMENRLVEDGDIIIGPSYKGSAIALATSILLLQQYGINTLFDYDRKEEKGHGESTKKESPLVNKTLFDGAKLFIVDDVRTSMKTKKDLLEKLHNEARNNNYSIKIMGVGLGVDREQVGPVYDESKPENLPNKDRVILGKRGEDAIGKFIKDTGILVYSIVGIREIINYLFSEKCPLMINGQRQPMDNQTFNNFNKYMEIYGVRR